MMTLPPSLPLPSLCYCISSYTRHGNGRFFSCKGILIAVQWFVQKGHQQVTVFVPSWRKEASRPETPISDQEILYQLEREGYLVFTPSRRIGARKIVCYDDRFIVRLAAMTDGIIVSNDNFRDLVDEKPEWRDLQLCTFTVPFHFPFHRFIPYSSPVIRDALVYIPWWH